MRNLTPLAFVALLASTSLTRAVEPNAYSPQNILIGATPQVQASANYGAGVTFGIIDTGGSKSWIGFQGFNGKSNQGRITSTICIVKCTAKALKSGNVDDNGHGTFVASEIIGGIPSIGMAGVAPAANVIDVKALNTYGSGTAADISKGIRAAVDKGARIINLSLGPTGNAAAQALFFNSLASAVNYAASKNAVIVFAGGNSSLSLSGGANITGYTDQALSRMLFVGSTNMTGELSVFSNTPGTAGFISTSGKFMPYSMMWVTAAGENIIGASNYYTGRYGYGYITTLSGTSMAAPQVAGAAGLLASRWPFLLAAGTIPTILVQTAADLGDYGADSKYGAGFLRVDLAMQPIGTPAAPVSNGSMVAVASNGGQIRASRAFGGMPAMSKALGNAVSYDKYMRGYRLYNVPVFAGSLDNGDTPATQLASENSGLGARNLTILDERTWATFTGARPESPSLLATDDDGRLGLTLDPSRPAVHDWSYGLMRGTTFVGMGEGSGAGMSFSDARWGVRSAFFSTGESASSALIGTLQQPHFASFGAALDNHARVAFSLVSQSAEVFGLSPGEPASAVGAALAYTLRPVENMLVSVTSSFLNEDNVVLGARATGNLLGLGPSAYSHSIGFGTNIDLGEGYQVGFDTAYVSTAAMENGDSFIGNISRLSSRSFSFALVKENLTGAGDTLSVAISKPLRVYSGHARVNVPVSTDDNSQPIIETSQISLVPDGSETDFALAYDRALTANISTSIKLIQRTDADNAAGAEETAAMTRVTLTF